MELNLFSYLSDKFTELKDLIVELTKKSNAKAPTPYRSPQIDQIGIALAKAQGEMGIAGLNKNNPYFKSAYADLSSIVGVSRRPLTKHGLAVSQILSDDANGCAWLETILIHGESGQWICSRKRIAPTKNDIQSISSHTTYVKRMAYSAMIGVVAGDEDDDGEADVATSRKTYATGTALNSSYNPRENTTVLVTKDQLDELEYELAEIPDFTEEVLSGLKIANLADMPKAKYQRSLQRIREVKELRKGNRK